MPSKISIHAPHAGCDERPVNVEVRFFEFQSTHPMRGATMPAIRTWSSCTYFNPRTPCGVRHYHLLIFGCDFTISIHAPHAGCDMKETREVVPVTLFQSTHPMRGATRPEYPGGPDARDFNPRTPCGVRPVWRLRRATLKGFQSTHPMRGATSVALAEGNFEGISIHAPHAGCDDD